MPLFIFFLPYQDSIKPVPCSFWISKTAISRTLILSGLFPDCRDPPQTIFDLFGDSRLSDRAKAHSSLLSAASPGRHSSRGSVVVGKTNSFISRKREREVHRS